MEFATPFKIIILIVVTGVSRPQNYQWTPCSRTCGQGTRSRRCGPTELDKCLAKYEDCTLGACPDATCCASSVLKYDSRSECCKKVGRDSCGVVQVLMTSRRVVGGQISKDGQWPWLAALWQKIPEKYFCGGALVNEKWVVTAAHCFEDTGYTAQEVMVKLGMSKQVGQNPNVQTTDVEEYIKYPSYKEWTDDLALLKLRTSMRYSTHVQPICMPGSEQPDQDTICYVAGWGFASLADIQARKTSNKLLHAGLRVVPLGACKEAYRKQASYSGVTNKTLCAGILSGGKDSCGGDSGSPLVCQRKTSCQWYFAGIVSFGAVTCGAKNTPAVYTNVQVYENWISDQIKDPCKPDPCQNGGKCSTNFRGTVKCDCPLGYEGKRCQKSIGCSVGLTDKLNDRVTISSSLSSSIDVTDADSPRLGAQATRSSMGSWCGRAGGRDWIEIKFKTVRLLAGIVTQGNPSGDQWVRTFKVFCGSERGDYKEYTENGVKKIFQANSNSNSKVFNIFAELLSCRSIRIVPNTWHSQPCLGLELLHGGCYASQVYNFYVKSQGANDGWRCHIYVNGVEKAVRGRGFCVVIFNPTTGTFNSDTFDTHAKSASETTRMIKFLDNANEYSIVAIAVGDAASSSTRVQPTLITKLHEFGAVGVSCDLRTYAFRDSFAFISQKLPSNSERPAWVSCQHVKRYGGYAAVHATIKTTKYFVDN